MPDRAQILQREAVHLFVVGEHRRGFHQAENPSLLAGQSPQRTVDDRHLDASPHHVRDICPLPGRHRLAGEALQRLRPVRPAVPFLALALADERRDTWFDQDQLACAVRVQQGKVQDDVGAEAVAEEISGLASSSLTAARCSFRGRGDRRW